MRWRKPRPQEPPASGPAGAAQASEPGSARSSGVSLAGAARTSQALDPGIAVWAEGLVKRFGETIALDHVTFAVRAGELFGFIGPDGAGKTTLFRTLVTLLVPDEGECRVLGRDPVADLWDLRARVGYMSGRFSLYPDLSVGENLDFFASVFGTSVEREYQRIAPIWTQLEPFRDRRAGALSGGMKQKLALCCALVHRPEILFLDEPTTGVDAVSRREFLDLLAELKSGGLTVVVSTPYMDEADRCDRVALIQRGRLIAIDTPRGITGSFDRPLLAVRSADRHRLLSTVRDYPHAARAYPFGESLHAVDARADVSGASAAAELAAYLEARGFADAAVEPTPATIEDSFMALMGAPEGEAA
jgi:ABC-2 type transport system ATP-binding protein